MPLIYSGQEIGMKQQLEFFEKDEIVWKESEYENYYIALIQLKKHHKALWNGRYGGEVSWIYTNHNDEVLAFVREKEGHGILVILNFSDKQMNVILKDESHAGQYKEFYSGIEKSFKGFDSVIMLPYECCLFYNTKGLPKPLF
jgi:glycosidase